MSTALPFSRWVRLPGFDGSPIDFDATAGILYPFGDAAAGYWQAIHEKYTALIFVVWCDEGSTLALPEASFDALVAESGDYAPKSFTIAAGKQASLRWGIDVVWPFWRFSLDGGKGRVGVAGIPRGL